MRLALLLALTACDTADPKAADAYDTAPLPDYPEPPAAHIY